MALSLEQSHRERKKAATRQAIHAAAFDLVSDGGLDRATVEVISERAGVATRTFWCYFASKVDAVIDRDPDRPERLRRELLQRPGDEDVLASLRHVLGADLAGRVADRQQALRRIQLIRREPDLMAASAAAFDEVERALVAGVGERLGRDPRRDLLPGVLVSAALGASRVVMQRWADGKGRQPLPILMDEAFARLAAGLSDRAPEPQAKAV